MLRPCRNSKARKSSPNDKIVNCRDDAGGGGKCLEPILETGFGVHIRYTNNNFKEFMELFSNIFVFIVILKWLTIW